MLGSSALGEFALGQDTGEFNGVYSLTAATGVFSFGGAASALKYNRNVPLASGSFTTFGSTANVGHATFRTPIEWVFKSIKTFAVGSFELQPSTLVFNTESFTSDTGQFTTYTEGTIGSFAVTGGRGVITNTGDQTTFVKTGPDITIPDIFVSIDVAANTGSPSAYNNIAVGIIKDNDNIVAAGYDHKNSLIRVNVKNAGTSTVLGQTSASYTVPFKLALSILANSCAVWVDTGSGWTVATKANIGSNLNLKTASLAGWKSGFVAAMPSAASWSFDNLVVGRFGALGLRDQCMMTTPAGDPFVSGSTVYFTASRSEPNGESATGVFSLDMAGSVAGAGPAVAQIGTIWVSRDGASQNDLPMHLVNNGDGTTRVFSSTWGNNFGGSLRIQTAQVSINFTTPATNFLTTLASITLPASGGGSVSGTQGVFDAYGVLLSGTWYVGYAWTSTTSFTSEVEFYPVLATSADLSSFTYVGTDSSRGNAEGTKLFNANGNTYVIGCGRTTSQIYNTSMTFLGYTNISVTGGSDTQPHVMPFKIFGAEHALTFNNTRFGGVSFTWGDLILHRASLVDYEPPMSVGQFSFSGATSTLSRGRNMPATPGAFVFSGNTAQLLLAVVLPGDTGNFGLFGRNLDVVFTRATIAAPGAFVLTGQAANLLYIRHIRLDGDTGVFVFSGSSADLVKAFTFNVNVGAFAFTGGDLVTMFNHGLSAAPGTFVLTGQDANLLYIRRIRFDGDTGVFILGGQTAGLAYNRKMPGESGTFVFTGLIGALDVVFLMAADTGQFSLTGSINALAAFRRLNNSPGVFLFTGSGASALAFRRLGVERGSFRFDTREAALAFNRKIAGDTAVYILTGSADNLAAHRRLPVTRGEFNLTPSVAPLVAQRRLGVNTGVFALGGSPAALQQLYRLAVASGAFDLSGASAGFLVGRRLLGVPGEFVLTGYQAELFWSGGVIRPEGARWQADLTDELVDIAQLKG